MKRAGSFLLKGLLKGVALLPFPVLYFFADIIFLLLFYVVRYRRKLVLRNLTDSFPDKTEKEVRRIRRRFYRNFADYIVETLKLGHISDRTIRKRVSFENDELLTRLIASGRSIVVYFSHCGNWEWGTSASLLHSDCDNVVFGQVYRPLRNKFTDSYMLGLRSRFGNKSYPKAKVLRELLRAGADGKITVTGFMSDQKPSHGDRVHILRFLNHPTAVITGTETLARKLDMAVVYWDMTKDRRGHYTITNRLIAESLADKPDFYATDSYISMLEKTIERQPAIWLWTHNRWKHKVEMPDNL